jgi:hypothetical protein
MIMISHIAGLSLSFAQAMIYVTSLSENDHWEARIKIT